VLQQQMKTISPSSQQQLKSLLTIEQERVLCLLKKIQKPLPPILPNTKSQFCDKKTISNNRINSIERQWKVIFLQKTMSVIKGCKIEIRTRNEEPCSVVPERLYSSLKYEIYHEIPASIFGEKIAVLMAKVQIVNPDKSEEEIIKRNDGNTVIKGTSSMAPVTINQEEGRMDILTCKQKVQFTDVSFHHEKKFFAFKVSYFKPNNLQEPILVMLSAPFQVFARRPRKKKRRTEVSIPVVAKKQKKQQIKKKENPLEKFLQCLDLLVQHRDSLNEFEQKLALETAQRRLFNEEEMVGHHLNEETQFNTFEVKPEHVPETPPPRISDFDSIPKIEDEDTPSGTSVEFDSLFA
jgi:hypothetical protein